MSKGSPAESVGLDPAAESGNGDSGAQKTQTNLRRDAFGSPGDLSTGGQMPGTSSVGRQLFDRDRINPGGSYKHTGLEIAMVGDGQTKAAKAEASPPKPKPTGEVYKRNGKPVPIYDHKTTIPSNSVTWDKETGKYTESFPEVCGTKDPLKEYGGSLNDEKISQTVAFHGETKIGDKTGQKMEFTDMKGVAGYGQRSAFGVSVSGETPVHSVKMTKVDTGNKDAKGEPIYDCKREAVVDQRNWKGSPITDKKTGQPARETLEEPMTVAEFDKLYTNFSPERLAQFQVAQTGRAGNNPRMADAIEHKKNRSQID